MRAESEKFVIRDNDRGIDIRFDVLDLTHEPNPAQADVAALEESSEQDEENHITPEVLELLGHNQLSKAQAANLTNHLKACSDCARLALDKHVFLCIVRARPVVRLQ